MMRVLFLSMLLAVLISMASASSGQVRGLANPQRELGSLGVTYDLVGLNGPELDGESIDGGDSDDSDDSGDDADDTDDEDCYDACWGDATDEEIAAWTEDQWIEWETCTDSACDCEDDECQGDADCVAAICDA
ncbi:expressed unknown protein [Seminavis robusta]|uniref:Uncharacterized protein n=1 Tax=Seminavis robusta TaxID=568900 RepID=A0A9N8DVU3_9STRA|nr:expressed unknown protein [Seminavis robusta]|eukprot:Sro284_g107950.1 n/a (133) ;mRNA; f:41734-42354